MKKKSGFCHEVIILVNKPYSELISEQQMWLLTRLPLNVSSLIESKYTKNYTAQARKFKKGQAKKLLKSNITKKFFREIAFLAVLNFFPVQKLICGYFWNCKKGNLVKKFFVKLIYLISRVFLRGLFLIFWPAVWNYLFF